MQINSLVANNSGVGGLTGSLLDVPLCCPNPPRREIGWSSVVDQYQGSRRRRRSASWSAVITLLITRSLVIPSQREWKSVED